MSEKGYAGRISNTGAQHVEAPLAPKPSKAKNVVVRGDDLRASKTKSEK